uniref:Ketosynthase family 3 (KS3) domain-containing protein n=1 Tax=Bombyx mori TaxID=7091 RepID=A0A8R2M1F3_BOMMO|nr:fatty acid synthase isoform X3 [Bombyx mori]
MPENSRTVERMSEMTFKEERVVISGMSGLYPASKSIKDLADVLYNKKNPITSENQRWNYSHPEVVQYTGKLPELNKFDAQFFKVHYRLANNMDPMAKKVLEQTYQAIYDAGVSPEHLSGKNVGVYIGMSYSETEKACFYVADCRTGFGIAGCNKAMFANRISYWLNVKGPSLAVDEACCSSIAALEQAFFAISRGECEAAIVGAVNLCLHPQCLVHYGRIVNLCMDGKTKSFDRHADGCAKSEAINVLFLQKAKNALRIYAKIVHVKSGITMLLEGETGPRFGFDRDPKDTATFLKNFYEEAGVSPDVVEYVEAFGSGVLEADKSEIEAIDSVFCKNRKNPLAIGSVMSNIGNSDAASGISSITKVLLGYETGLLAGNLHYKTPRDDISAIRDGRVYVLDDHAPTKRNYAAVNSMSLTGINAHVLLKGHYKRKDPNRYKSSIPHLVAISGRQDSAVRTVIDDLKSRPIDPEELALLHNIHQTTISGHMGRGFVILDQDDEQNTVCLKERIEYFDDAIRPLWFVYSGMGSQWPTMGKQLMRIPIFAASIERCRRVLEPKGVNIVDILTSSDSTIFDNILHSFVGIAAVQIGLTDILKSLGIEPDKIIGHSVGELGCAYADGCLTTEEMILSAYSRGLVSVQTPFIQGSMAAVGIGYQEISKMCPPSIEVACHNSSQSSTVSGPAQDMKQFIAELVAKGIFAKEVPCSNIAYHSRYIAEAGPGLLKYLKEVIKTPRMRSDRWVSTSVPQHRWNEPSAKYSSAEYHTNNLLNPVLFEETANLIPSNAVLIEIAPHGLLQAILKRSLPSNCLNIALTRRGHPNNAVLLLEAIGNLYMEGFTPRLQELYPKVEFPVSTGTPMLSHLVEWVHSEKWPLPLFVSAHRITAASCKFVISLHDDESNIFYGNVIRGKILYPFAAALVAAWDTLAMTLQIPKNQMSVTFHNVKLYSQPILHEQRQLRLGVALHRGTGRFEIMSEHSKVATGFIIKTKVVNQCINEVDSDHKDMELNADDIYHLLKLRDYSYSGDFRSVHNGNSILNSFSIIWNDNWVTFIDGLLQVNALRQRHDGVSQPAEIRKLCIDVTEHRKHITKVDNKEIIPAKVLEKHETTKAGGVLLQGLLFQQLPPVILKGICLKSSKFIPRFNAKLDDVSAIHVFLQIVMENIDKDELNVLGILNDSGLVHPALAKITNEFNGISIHYKELSRKILITKKSEHLADADLVVVRGMTTDSCVCQIFFQELKRGIFILNIEDKVKSNDDRPDALYRVVSSIGKLQLLRWRPSEVHDIGAAVSVTRQSDIALLISTLNSLSPRSRLLVFTVYPPLEGFLDLIRRWRKENGFNNIYVIMGDHESHNLANLNLSINVSKNGAFGGYYYLPLKQEATKEDCELKLECSVTGNLNSLKWVQNSQSSTPGIEVKVHYAGLSKMDVSKALGESIVINSNVNCFGFDFSGVTRSGARVMGIAVNGSCKSTVRARTDLLWPIPDHWDFEEAATVPMAYLTAFYCLHFCVGEMVRCRQNQNALKTKSILVHAGAGALGQALISIGLALDYEVFTTVSDSTKKRFLKKLFPNLKEQNIGSSRDTTFADMVLCATNHRGCNIVINCLRGELRNASLRCSAGWTLDISEYDSQESSSFGMGHLTADRSYVTVNVSHLLMTQNSNKLKMLHSSLSEGISRGYVRPLSRVKYGPSEVSRAFRLLATRQHRGRILLKLDEFPPSNKLREWKKLGVKVQMSSEKINSQAKVHKLINDAACLGCVDGIIVDATNACGSETEEIRSTIHNLDIVSRKLFQSLRYFTLVTDDNSLGLGICLTRQNDGYPVTVVNIGHLKEDLDTHNFPSSRLYVEATEAALCSGDNSVVAFPSSSQQSLLQQLCAITDVDVTRISDENTTLGELGVVNEKTSFVSNYLRVHYGITLNEEDVLSLTFQRIKEMEDAIVAPGYSTKKGLEAFYSYVDPDELLATSEMVLMPTLTSSATARDDEFDVTVTSLCIVPGLEGHHGRFRALCERLKLPALVLQPGLDKLDETIQQTAQRYASSLLRKSAIKNNFYILGYETGIFVALELTAILEEHDMTGTLFLLGGSPNDVSNEIEYQLQGFKTDQLQEAVARHMFKIMAREHFKEVENAFSKRTLWNDRVDAGVRTLLGHVSHSAQYARAQIEAACARLVYARRYGGPAAPLRSRLVLLRSPLTARSAPPEWQRLSRGGVTEHNLLAPLPHAAMDMRCATIINKYLDDEILDQFNKKNLCETYLLSADTYMSFVTDLN